MGVIIADTIYTPFPSNSGTLKSQTRIVALKGALNIEINMRDREVTFDGKSLSFNGEMPDSYEINGKYTIDRESLIRLVSALKKGVYGVVKQKIFSSSYLGCKSSYYYWIYSRNDLPEGVEDMINALNRRVKELEGDIEYHNSLPWYKRFKKIE